MAEPVNTANCAGIGKFTIADDNLVTEADLGVNFFLEETSLGESRAKSCMTLLQELNPDVKGDWFPQRKVRAVRRLRLWKLTIVHHRVIR